MGLEADKVSTIIEAHAETVDGLKEQIAQYKADAESAKTLQAELDKANKDLETFKAGGNEWQSKYEAVNKEFEDFKTAQADKDLKASKEKAYRQLLVKAGVSEKRLDSIMRLTDVKDLELNDEGAFSNADELTESIKTEWADFISSPTVIGARVTTPPANDGTSLTKADIYKKDDKGRYVMSASERQKAIADNPEAFA